MNVESFDIKDFGQGNINTGGVSSLPSVSKIGDVIKYADRKTEDKVDHNGKGIQVDTFFFMDESAQSKQDFVNRMGDTMLTAFGEPCGPKYYGCTRISYNGNKYDVGSIDSDTDFKTASRTQKEIEGAFCLTKPIEELEFFKTNYPNRIRLHKIVKFLSLDTTEYGNYDHVFDSDLDVNKDEMVNFVFFDDRYMLTTGGCKFIRNCSWN